MGEWWSCSLVVTVVVVMVTLLGAHMFSFRSISWATVAGCKGDSREFSGEEGMTVVALDMAIYTAMDKPYFVALIASCECRCYCCLLNKESQLIPAAT